MVIGAYDAEYPRVRHLIKGLHEIEYQIWQWNIRCQLALQILRFIHRLPRIIGDAIKSDFILVPYPGWRMVFFAKIVSILSGKPLVFDAHISNYNTRVEDRKTVAPSSYRAIYEWLLDKVTCTLSDIVLIDTYAHGSYFNRRFNLSSNKIVRVFVGVDPRIHRKIDESDIQFERPLIYFYGTFIPLQGVLYILDALAIVKERGYRFNFILIGSGQEETVCEKRIESHNLRKYITRFPYIPYSELLSLMKKSDICLGIFGESMKAQIVIPNKVYDYAAMNKVFITGDSRAMRELFEEGKDYVGCKFADAEDIAEKLMSIIDNLAEYQSSMNPIERVQKYATPEKIAAQLIKDLRMKHKLQT